MVCRGMMSLPRKRGGVLVGGRVLTRSGPSRVMGMEGRGGIDGADGEGGGFLLLHED